MKKRVLFIVIVSLVHISFVSGLQLVDQSLFLSDRQVNPDLPDSAITYIERHFPEDSIDSYEWLEEEEEFEVAMESEVLLYFDADGEFIREESIE